VRLAVCVEAGNSGLNLKAEKIIAHGENSTMEALELSSTAFSRVRLNFLPLEQRVPISHM
jgi:hypothetical protein